VRERLFPGRPASCRVASRARDQAAAGPLPITSSRMGCLLDALDRGYRVLGLDEAAGGDGVFRQLVLARIIEPASKIDSFEPTQAGNVGSAACAS
jgi:hypothetical protein